MTACLSSDETPANPAKILCLGQWSLFKCVIDVKLIKLQFRLVALFCYKVNIAQHNSILHCQQASLWLSARDLTDQCLLLLPQKWVPALPLAYWSVYMHTMTSAGPHTDKYIKAKKDSLQNQHTVIGPWERNQYNIPISFTFEKKKTIPTAVSFHS